MHADDALYLPFRSPRHSRNGRGKRSGRREAEGGNVTDSELSQLLKLIEARVNRERRLAEAIIHRKGRLMPVSYRPGLSIVAFLAAAAVALGFLFWPQIRRLLSGVE